MGVATKVAQAARQNGGIALRDHEPGNAVLHQFTIAASVPADHRQAARHVLHQGVRAALLGQSRVGHEHTHVGLPDDAERFDPSVDELHHAPPLEVGRRSLQTLPVRAAAHEGEAPVVGLGAECARRCNDDPVVLFGLHATDHDDPETGRRRSGGLHGVQAGGIETVIDDVPLERRNSPRREPGAGVGDHEPGGRHAAALERDKLAGRRRRADGAVDERDPQCSTHRSREQGGHPAPQMNDVGAPRPQRPPEGGHDRRVESAATLLDGDRHAARAQILRKGAAGHRPHAPLVLLRQTGRQECELTLGPAVGQSVGQ